jgi:mono/diheme cytochrome c family protein
MFRPTRPIVLSASTALTVLVTLAAATACGGESSAPKRQFAVPKARQEAQATFQSLCFTCHGDKGLGDGPGAAACDPKPRSFSDPAWQDSVTDEQIQKTIVFGGAAVGKSAQMPAQPQLKGQTEVLAELVTIVRAFRKQQQ